ncbi:MAG TPA: recombinase family protein, partial [Bacilli bacterium]|nr:recombinase family protein [Bacilli bacterium]
MTKTIEVIMPHKIDTSLTKTNKTKLRVAAYARVSTDEDDQVNSFKSQIDEYTERITSNPDWDFIGMFADKGITGTQTKKRPEFMRMVELGMERKIDLILVKSISRFARNTVDVLTTVRELRNRGCIIFFEKENIRSDDTKIDFVLTVLSSVAQEESRSISTNVKWSIEKKFKNGIAHVTNIYGYRKGENGDLIIEESEATIVRLIFSLFIEGYNINDIVKILNDRKIPTLKGKSWLYSTVRGLLSNEKYMGDAILQKTCTVDYLTHKQVKNDNIEPKYYVTNHHEGIIKRDEYETV